MEDTTSISKIMHCCRYCADTFVLKIPWNILLWFFFHCYFICDWDFQFEVSIVSTTRRDASHISSSLKERIYTLAQSRDPEHKLGAGSQPVPQEKGDPDLQISEIDGTQIKDASFTHTHFWTGFLVKAAGHSPMANAQKTEAWERQIFSPLELFSLSQCMLLRCTNLWTEDELNSLHSYPRRLTFR